MNKQEQLKALTEAKFAEFSNVQKLYATGKLTRELVIDAWMSFKITSENKEAAMKLFDLVDEFKNKVSQLKHEIENPSTAKVAAVNVFHEETMRQQLHADNIAVNMQHTAHAHAVHQSHVQHH